MTQASSVHNLISNAREQVSALLSRPVFRRPFDMIDQRRQRLDNAVRSLMFGGKNRFELHKNRLSLVLAKLEALSPLRVLARGYSVTRRESDNFVVTSIADVDQREALVTRVRDGLVYSTVERTKRQDSN